MKYSNFFMVSFCVLLSSVFSASSFANSICSSSSWCWSIPVPTGNGIHGIRKLDDGRLFAFGSAETFINSNDQGKTWSGNSGIGWKSFNDAWVESKTQTVWAVGSGGKIIKYKSNSWEESQTGVTSNLLAIWGVSADAIWAVGDGVALFYDGISWHKPDGLDLKGYATGVWASSTKDVWISGDDFVLHYDGSNWRQLRSNNYERRTLFTGVWGDGLGNVYFTSSGGVSGLQKYDSKTDSILAQVQTPEAGRLYDISGNSPSDIWAVGTYEVWHFDGKQWHPIAQNGGTHYEVPEGLQLEWYNSVHGVSAFSPSDVWITGAQGYMVHWDGKSWSQVSSAPVKLAISLGAASDSLMLAGGTGDSLWAFSKYANWLFDGLKWQLTENSIPLKWSGGTVSAFSNTKITLRIDRIDQYGPWQLWQKLNTLDWQMTKEFSNQQVSVWAIDEKNIYVLGVEGLWHFNGIKWDLDKLISSGEHSAPAIRGTGASHVWIRSSGKTIFEFDGVSWKRLNTDSIDKKIDCSWESSLWTDRVGHGFIGCAGAVIEFVDGQWIVHDFEGHQAITAIEGEANLLFAVGGSRTEWVHSLDLIVEEAYGAAYVYDGKKWVEEPTGMTAPITGAWWDSKSKEIWAVSRQGILRKK